MEHFLQTDNRSIINEDAHKAAVRRLMVGDLSEGYATSLEVQKSRYPRLDFPHTSELLQRLHFSAIRSSVESGFSQHAPNRQHGTLCFTTVAVISRIAIRERVHDLRSRPMHIATYYYLLCIEHLPTLCEGLIHRWPRLGDQIEPDRAGREISWIGLFVRHQCGYIEYRDLERLR